MTDNEIIEKYNSGFPISSIFDMYYASANINKKHSYYEGNSLIISKDFLSKKEAQHFVENVICDYLFEIKKKGVKTV